MTHPRIAQLQNLVRYYRKTDQGACAEALEWALLRITQLENDLHWWYENVGNAGLMHALQRAVMHAEIDKAVA